MKKIVQNPRTLPIPLYLQFPLNNWTLYFSLYKWYLQILYFRVTQFYIWCYQRFLLYLNASFLFEITSVLFQQILLFSWLQFLIFPSLFNFKQGYLFNRIISSLCMFSLLVNSFALSNLNFLISSVACFSKSHSTAFFLN